MSCRCRQTRAPIGRRFAIRFATVSGPLCATVRVLTEGSRARTISVAMGLAAIFGGRGWAVTFETMNGALVGSASAAWISVSRAKHDYGGGCRSQLHAHGSSGSERPSTSDRNGRCAADRGGSGRAKEWVYPNHTTECPDWVGASLVCETLAFPQSRQQRSLLPGDFRQWAGRLHHEVSRS